MKTVTVATAIGDTFSVGQELTRGPAIAAYLMGVLNALKEADGEETTLTAPEIIRTVNATKTDGMSPADAEGAYINALLALESGETDEEAPEIDIHAANAQKVSASAMGAKLNGTFNEHMVAILNAGELVQYQGPVQVSDDVSAKWTKEEIKAMPMPGSRLDPKDKDDVSKSNLVYDHYKTTDHNGDKIIGSWFGDIFLTTKEGTRIADKIAALVKEKGEAKDEEIDRKIKMERGRISKATNMLRKAVTFLLATWALADGCPTLQVEVKREADGTPERTQYPVLVGVKGSMNGKALTLNQVLSLVKEDVEGFTGIERTIAKGGTIKALVDYGLPKKAPKKTAALKVANPDASYDVGFALNNYLEGGGSEAWSRLVNGPKSEAWVTLVGDIFSHVAPIYNSGDVADRYRAYNAKTTPTAKKAA